MNRTLFSLGLLVTVTHAGCDRKVAVVTPPEALAIPAPLKWLVSPLPDPSLVDWEERAKRVYVGMRRQEVEALLPEYWWWPPTVTPVTLDSRPAQAVKISPPIDNASGQRFGALTVGTGGGQSVSYHVSEDVTVGVSYDYTGNSGDNWSSPENRVTAPVTVRREAKYTF